MDRAGRGRSIERIEEPSLLLRTLPLLCTKGWVALNRFRFDLYVNSGHHSPA
jgi:hypothetical protein